MARRPAAETRINTSAQNRRKATQLERLHAGMIAAANREGYAGANVSAVIAQAGVSRPTFYDYFEDRDDCFLKTVAYVHEQLLADVREAIAQAPGELALARCRARDRRVREHRARAGAVPDEGGARRWAGSAGRARSRPQRDARRSSSGPGDGEPGRRLA